MGREFGWGAFAVLEQPDKAVLAHTLTVDDRVIIAVHNFASEPREVQLTLPVAQGERRLTDVFSGEQTPVEGDSLTVSLDGYGYRWLRLTPLDDTGLY